MARFDASEFISGYLAEAEELLATANTNLLALDESLRKKENNPRAVRELFRALHTLKGLSAMIAVEPIVDLSHEMETLLRSADRAGGRVPDNAVDLLLRGVRAIEERVSRLSRGETVAPAPKELLELLGSLDVGQTPGRATAVLSLEPELLAKLSLAEQEQVLGGLRRGLRALRVDFVPSPERAAADVNITSVRKRVGALGDLVKVVPRAGGSSGVSFALIVLTAATDAEVAEAAAASPADVIAITAEGPSPPEGLPEFDAAEDLETQQRNFVRVDVQRLDDALERLAVLVVSRSRLERAVHELAGGSGDLRTVSRLVADGGRELRDLRSAIMRARMVSVSELLERAPLIVRGLSKASKKLVRLSVDAGRAELDKAVADRLFPVVVHLLRNAVDHAIELPDERRRRGKPDEGHVSITCVEHAGSRLELIVADDGRGIDRERVAARAHAEVPVSDADLLRLITRPGLSTLDAATQTSGRGLGMDIVKRIAVEQLGGELHLKTEPHVGTTFTLTVPISITIVDAFSLECGGQTFAVPVSTVDDLAEIQREAVVETPEARGGSGSVRLLRHRDTVMPLFSLSSLLGMPPRPLARAKAVIVRKQADMFAFEVERLLGQQEIVVRPVKDPLVSMPGIAGSTDLGDGRPTLLLDLLGLIRSAPEARVG